MSKRTFAGSAAVLKEMLWSLDLDPIVVKVMYEESWTLQQALSAVEEYRRFLFLTVTKPEAIVPTEFVDAVWHAHILDTAKYRDDCQQLFGFFLDHFPYFGMRGKEDQETLQATFANTANLYESVFGGTYFVGARGANCGTCGYGNCSPVDDITDDVVRPTERPRLAA